MGAHAIVTLVITGLALAVTAGYLIHIARILWGVIDNLVTILGAVQAVTDNSKPAEPVMNDISRNLAAAAETLEGAVGRLAERRAPAAAAAVAAEAGKRYIPGDAHRMPTGQTVPAGHHPGRAPDISNMDWAPELAPPPPADTPYAPSPAAVDPASTAGAPQGGFPSGAPPGGDPAAPQPPSQTSPPQAPPQAPPQSADPAQPPPPGEGEEPGDQQGVRWWRNR